VRNLGSARFPGYNRRVVGGGVNARRVTLAVAALALALLSSVPAASAGTTKLTPSENTWAVPVVNLMKSLSGRVGAIRHQVADPAVVNKGSAARKKLTVTLREIVLCGQRLKKDGTPPTARLKPFHSAVKSACSYYMQGAAELIVGIAKLNPTLIKSSMTTIKHGSALLALAQSRLVPLAS
jgi:hypothetical protein